MGLIDPGHVVPAWRDQDFAGILEAFESITIGKSLRLEANRARIMTVHRHPFDGFAVRKKNEFVVEGDLIEAIQTELETGLGDGDEGQF
jgi:hypothetical protein